MFFGRLAAGSVRGYLGSCNMQLSLILNVHQSPNSEMRSSTGALSHPRLGHDWFSPRVANQARVDMLNVFPPLTPDVIHENTHDHHPSLIVTHHIYAPRHLARENLLLKLGVGTAVAQTINEPETRWPSTTPKTTSLVSPVSRSVRSPWMTFQSFSSKMSTINAHDTPCSLQYLRLPAAPNATRNPPPSRRHFPRRKDTIPKTKRPLP